jgi:hypothetical protein
MLFDPGKLVWRNIERRKKEFPEGKRDEKKENKELWCRDIATWIQDKFLPQEEV